MFSRRCEVCLLKRKVNGKTIWYYSFYDDNGVRKYRSTGEKTKAAAWDYVMKRRDEGLLKSMDSGSLPFGVYAKDFYDYDKCPIIQNKLKRGKKFAHSTAYGNRYILKKHIMPFFKTVPMSEITPAKVNDWLLRLPGKQKIGNRTVNLCKAVMSHIMDYAVSDGTIAKNPCKDVENLGAEENRIKAFSKEEMKLLIGEPENWKEPMIRTMCMIAAMTGMRASEILALRPCDIGEDRIFVRHSYNTHDGLKPPKNGEERVVPITKQLSKDILFYSCGPERFLFSYDCGETPINYVTFRRKFTERRDAVGIKDKSLHSFRGFMNTELTLANINEAVIRDMIGHKDEKMTEHYLHMESGDMQLVRNIQEGLFA